MTCSRNSDIQSHTVSNCLLNDKNEMYIVPNFAVQFCNSFPVFEKVVISKLFSDIDINLFTSKGCTFYVHKVSQRKPRLGGCEEITKWKESSFKTRFRECFPQYGEHVHEYTPYYRCLINLSFLIKKVQKNTRSHV